MVTKLTTDPAAVMDPAVHLDFGMLPMRHALHAVATYHNGAATHGYRTLSQAGRILAVTEAPRGWDSVTA